MIAAFGPNYGSWISVVVFLGIGVLCAIYERKRGV